MSLQIQHIPYRSYPSSVSNTRFGRSHCTISASTIKGQSLYTTPRSTTYNTDPKSLIKSGKINRRDSLKKSPVKPSAIPRHIVEEIKQTQHKDNTKEVEAPCHEPNDDATMSPRSSKYSTPSSKASSPEAPPSKKTKSGGKEVDWADVTDPEERRRIQNRIAQRKFREKARENKEKAEREMRNQENAGNSYRIPTADDFMNDAEPAGLPWGGVNLGHILTRGHEIEGRRSSGRGTYMGDDPYRTNFYAIGYGHGIPQAASYGSSGTDDAYMEDPSYVYSPVLPTFPPPLTPQ